MACADCASGAFKCAAFDPQSVWTHFGLRTALEEITAAAWHWPVRFFRSGDLCRFVVAASRNSLVCRTIRRLAWVVGWLRRFRIAVYKGGPAAITSALFSRSVPAIGQVAHGILLWAFGSYRTSHRWQCIDRVPSVWRLGWGGIYVDSGLC